MRQTSTEKCRIRFLLLEGIHPSADRVLRDAGYSQIESLPGALFEDDLKTRIADVHFMGTGALTLRTRMLFQALYRQRPATCGAG